MLTVVAPGISVGDTSSADTAVVRKIEKTIVSKVYPNPFGSGTNITVKRESDESMELIVFNALGQVVHSSETSGSTTILDTSDWLPGVYIIRIGEETLRAVKSN